VDCFIERRQIPIAEAENIGCEIAKAVIRDPSLVIESAGIVEIGGDIEVVHWNVHADVLFHCEISELLAGDGVTDTVGYRGFPLRETVGFVQGHCSGNRLRGGKWKSLEGEVDKRKCGHQRCLYRFRKPAI